METRVCIKYAEGDAYYSIRREDPGIYSATLLYYTGENSYQPPAELILVRGVRAWTGSHKDKKLLNDLGAAIIQSLNASDIETASS